MQRLLRSIVPRSLLTAAPDVVAEKSGSAVAGPGGKKLFAFEARRPETTSSSGNGAAPVCDEAALGRFISMDFARQIYRAGAHRIVARNPCAPPSELGLLTLIAYINGPLHQKLSGFEHPLHGLRNVAELRQLAEWKALIAQTILRIEKSPVPVVRRNTQLGIDDLAIYAAGAMVRIDRLTSVTCLQKQAYTGGNADFVIHTKAGVVSVAPLSCYATSEAEGLLDPGTTYQVIEVSSGKENGRPSLDEAGYPARTIVLQEQ